MTVNTDNITSGPYIGNGTGDNFSYDFRVESASQLSVYETDDAGAQTLLTLTTDYTVAGVGDDGGGIITRVAGNLPTDYEWYIRSNYLETQLTVFSSQGPFLPSVHEAALDKLTFLIQQIQDGTGRSLRLSDSDSSIESGDMTLPSLADRLSQFLAFDADGNPIAASGVTSVPVSSYMETVLDDTTAAAAAATLEVYTQTEILSAALILLNKKLVDANTSIVDDGDNTKQMKFQCSGITTATTRTLTVPDADDTLVLLALAQTLLNKTTTDLIQNGTATGTAVQDDDAFASAAADKLASSESIKAYVDNTVAPVSIDAWTHFTVSGGTVTEQDGVNISSIGDNGSGDFTANFTVAFANATYALAGWTEGGGSSEYFVSGNAGDTMTTSAKQFKVASGGGALNDPTKCTVMFIGD